MSLTLTDISNLALTCGVADASLLNDANFSNRNLTNISQVAVLTNLRSLNLSFNKIVKLTALLPLRSLSVLNVMHNEIADLQPLVNLTTLSILRLSHNKCKDLSPLSSLLALEELWIQANPGASLAHVFAALKPLPLLHRPARIIETLNPLTIDTLHPFLPQKPQPVAFFQQTPLCAHPCLQARVQAESRCSLPDR
jgi:internalin A